MTSEQQMFPTQMTAMPQLKPYEGDPEQNLLKKKDLLFPPTQEEIIEKFKLIEDPELKALAFIGYQTAGRISELLKMKHGDIELKSMENKRYELVNLITLKNRKQPMRILPIPMFISNEALMFQYFNEVYTHRIGKIFGNLGTRNNVGDKFRHKITFNLKVLNFKTRSYEQREVKMHPHLLRHFRLTHLVTIYGFDAFKLQQYAGWSSILPAQTYVNMGASEIAEQFGKFRFLSYTKRKA